MTSTTTPLPTTTSQAAQQQDPLAVLRALRDKNSHQTQPNLQQFTQNSSNNISPFRPNPNTDSSRQPDSNTQGPVFEANQNLGTTESTFSPPDQTLLPTPDFFKTNLTRPLDLTTLGVKPPVPPTETAFAGFKPPERKPNDLNISPPKPQGAFDQFATFPQQPNQPQVSTESTIPEEKSPKSTDPRFKSFADEGAENTQDTNPTIPKSVEEISSVETTDSNTQPEPPSVKKLMMAIGGGPSSSALIPLLIFTKLENARQAA